MRDRLWRGTTCLGRSFAERLTEKRERRAPLFLFSAITKKKHLPVLLVRRKERKTAKSGELPCSLPFAVRIPECGADGRIAATVAFLNAPGRARRFSTAPFFCPPIFLPITLSPSFVPFGYHRLTTGRISADALVPPVQMVFWADCMRSLVRNGSPVFGFGS